MNPLFKTLGNNNTQGFIDQFNQFKKMFSGDPKQQVQQMLNSGKITQQQYDQAVQKANEMYRMLNGKI